MSRLAELQARLTTALLTGDDEVLRGEIVEEGMTASDRIDIYRNNLRTTLIEALAHVYPVIRRLVGEGFFRQVTRAFVRGQAPCVRSLVDYGGDFPEFLSIQPSARTHPYLGDVARLEWACHLAFHAADGTGLDVARLRRLPPDAWPGARVRMSPSLQLIRSSYPIARIWLENQPDRLEPCRIELRVGRTYTSVVRPDCDVEVRAHSAAEFQLLSLLKQGASILSAFEVALETSGPLDLEALLREWMVAGLIVGIDPAEGE